VVKLLLRYVVAAIALTAAVVLVAHHDHGGMKGTAIPVATVLVCLLAALATAWLLRRYSVVAAPLAAGIAGVVICGPYAGPYGGVLGLAVGIAVVLLSPPRQSAESPRQ
jgi:hypothetical protein